jgi:hypothetical protein
VRLGVLAVLDRDNKPVAIYVRGGCPLQLRNAASGEEEGAQQVRVLGVQAPQLADLGVAQDSVTRLLAAAGLLLLVAEQCGRIALCQALAERPFPEAYREGRQPVSGHGAALSIVP